MTKKIKEVLRKVLVDWKTVNVYQVLIDMPMMLPDETVMVVGHTLAFLMFSENHSLLLLVIIITDTYIFLVIIISIIMFLE